MRSRRELDTIFFDTSIQLHEAAKAYIDFYASRGTADNLQVPVTIKTVINNWRGAVSEAGYDQNGGPKPMATYNIKRGKSLIEAGNFVLNSLEASYGNGGTIMGPIPIAETFKMLRCTILNKSLEGFGFNLSTCFLDIAHQFIERFQGDCGEKASIVLRLEGLLKPYKTSIDLWEAAQQRQVGFVKQGWELVKELDKEVKQALLPPPPQPQAPFKTGGDEFVSTHVAQTVVNSGCNMNIGSGKQHNGDAELVMVHPGPGSGSSSGSGSGITWPRGMPMVLLQGNNWVNVGSYNTNTGSGGQGVHMCTPKASLRKE